MPYRRCNNSFPKICIVWDIQGFWQLDLTSDGLRLCEVTKNDGKANEAVLERDMIVLND